MVEHIIALLTAISGTIIKICRQLFKPALDISDLQFDWTEDGSIEVIVELRNRSDRPLIVSTAKIKRPSQGRIVEIMTGADWKVYKLGTPATEIKLDNRVGPGDKREIHLCIEPPVGWRSGRVRIQLRTVERGKRLKQHWTSIRRSIPPSSV